MRKGKAFLFAVLLSLLVASPIGTFSVHVVSLPVVLFLWGLLALCVFCALYLFRNIATFRIPTEWVGQHAVQPLPCCQLLALYNAVIFFGRQREIPAVPSRQFYDDVDLVDCEKTPPTRMELAFHKYGVWPEKLIPTLENIYLSLAKNRPVGIVTRTSIGWHISTVVAGHGDTLAVANLYSGAGTALHYVKYHDLPLASPDDPSYYAIAYQDISKGI